VLWIEPAAAGAPALGMGPDPNPRSSAESSSAESESSDPLSRDDYTRVIELLLPVLKASGYLVHELTGMGGFGNPDGTHTTHMGIVRLGPDTQHRRIDIKVYPSATISAAILHFTGSAQFNRFLSRAARELGYYLSSDGLFKLPPNHPTRAPRPPNLAPLRCPEERDIFDQLGLLYVEPTRRKDKSDVLLPDGTPFWSTKAGAAAGAAANTALR